MSPTATDDKHQTGVVLVRRVCPNCRLFFDTGIESESVFCSGACRDRHERGEYL